MARSPCLERLRYSRLPRKLELPESGKGVDGAGRRR